MPQLFKIFFLSSCLFFFSCANKKKIIYFQGDKDISADTLARFSSQINTDDLLSIVVMGLDAEAVKPFNLSTYGQQQDKTQDVSVWRGYLVDAGGEIDFPVIGRVKLAGLTRAEATELLKTRLKDYIREPMVNIQIINYKVTILGDVNRPGVYTIPNERVTLIEAIGLAGDLNITAKRKNILVIRDKNGRKTETRVDLTTKDIFNSPVFYLQQNDVVYVEPNRSKKNGAVVNATGVTILISLTTLLITLTSLLTR